MKAKELTIHQRWLRVIFAGTTLAYLLLVPFILCFIFLAINNINIELHQYTTIVDTKTREMRVTGYLPTGKLTAIGEEVVIGYTAAISPSCADSFLGTKVYIDGIGVRYVNDLTSKWVSEKYDMCTLDVAVPNNQEAMKIGNEIKRVVRISNATKY